MKKQINYQLEMLKGTVGPKLEMKYVAKTEAMMELDLPDSLYEFLDNHNGGVPVKRYFPLGKNVKVIEWFLCLDKSYKTSKFGQTDIGVVWSQIEDRLNEFLIPFASVFGGDFLCYDLTKKDEGNIVLWVHDRSSENNPYLVEVAKNFKEFLKILHGEEETISKPKKKKSK